MLFLPALGFLYSAPWVSLTCALLMLSISRQLLAWQLLLVSMLAVLLMDPLAAQFPGFWLSFGAVAALLYQFHDRKAASRRGLIGWLLLLIRVELTLLLLLGTLLGFWTGELPVVSVLANVFAMPLVSFLLVPTLLLSAVDLLLGSPFGWSGPLLLAADVMLHLVVTYLKSLGQLSPDFFSQLQGVNLSRALLSLLICCCLALPYGFPMRLLGVVLLPWLLQPSPVGPELEMVVFDVGQGTAISLRSRDRLLLYDLGPGGSFQWNLLPYLRSPADAAGLPDPLPR